jgi:acyl-CoA dehydrogenase
MDFSIPAELKDLQERTRAFIAKDIIPIENDPRCTPHGPNEDLRRELIAKGKKAELLSCHVSKEMVALGWTTGLRPSCLRKPVIRRSVRWH